PFGYDGHYCAVDRRENPTAAACGYFQSGIRVFDIRDPMHPAEIAYFNPPAQSASKAQLTGSEHASSAVGIDANLSTDWCSSPPRFVAPDQLWVTCQDNGFMALRFTNGAWPIKDAVTSPAAATAGDTGHYGGAALPGLWLPLLLAALRRRFLASPHAGFRCY
ncbi:MAG TPA: hypothetical protein VHE37_02925, partial [Nevskiaceae bacterium]|nr:hypothetical protein [Nevskiaceae bacterium]